ncbi:hypothetical protein [Xanthocytophaga agilis]|uniref:DUF2939 domain-containing protein n=1 Tax=Xanthocytophaga agilis TaxID=3048010 RepID=A0AAE3R661_9BACT|nr:hypothetical protein [Xanthocytophaga agilis]MDJ1504479.1 hypothetical protein [Xanthocytophaga agilis]
MNRKYLYSITGAVLLGVGGWFGYQKYREAQPLFALLQIKDAYETHDLSLFKKHVAIESVVNNAIDQIMAQTISKTTSNQSADNEIKIATDIIAFVKPRLVETIGEQVYKAVETGSLNLENSGDLAITSLKDASGPFMNGSYQFDEIENIEVHDTDALITLRFMPSDRHKKPFLLKCKMSKEEDDWKLVEILNTSELMELHNIKQ